MYTAHPSENERFYLRILLCPIHGPTSFDYLRSYENHTYATFKEAVIARGLLIDDIEWTKCWKKPLSIVILHKYDMSLPFYFLIVQSKIQKLSLHLSFQSWQKILPFGFLFPNHKSLYIIVSCCTCCKSHFAPFHSRKSKLGNIWTATI